MKIQEVHSYLKSHDIKPSPQKVAIMQYLMEHHTHPDVDKIYNALVPDMPTLSKTTVYNTLKLFCDKKVTEVIFIDEKNVRYDSVMTFHAHFRCKKCGHIYDVQLDKKDVPQCSNSELRSEETEVYFFGICGNCM